MTSLVAAIVRLGSDVLRDHLIGDPVLTPRLGLAVVRRGGLVCVSSVKIDDELFNHVSGYGTFAEPTQRGIDTVIRHYAGLDRPVRVEVPIPGVSRTDRALLERNGFRDDGVDLQCHVRSTSRRPRVRDDPGLAVERTNARNARGYARLATAGFGGHGIIADLFERGWTRQIRRDRRIAAFIGVVRGRPVTTGVLAMRRDVAGLYSGSVLPRYRGRGLQNAMIAARVRYGWDRGLRTFYSLTDPDNASARNLRDEGFRTRFEIHVYEREA